MDKKRILIVEDDNTLVKMLQERFQSEGFEVAAETDGESGLSRAKKDKPDIVVLDLILPKMEGISVLKNMRKDSSLSNTPVIIFTNRDDIETVSQTLESGGVVDFLAKHEWKLDDIVVLAKKRLNLPF